MHQIIQIKVLNGAGRTLAKNEKLLKDIDQIEEIAAMATTKSFQIGILQLVRRFFLISFNTFFIIFPNHLLSLMFLCFCVL